MTDDSPASVAATTELPFRTASSGRGFGRRRFLVGAVTVGAAAGAAAIGGPSLVRSGPRHDPARPGATSSGRPGEGILVLVGLYGGNDGENTVIPYADPAYLGGRPTLGYQPHEVLTLDAGLGLHPNLAGLKGLWDRKQLAIVRGVGYPQPSHSHFRGMDIWQSAIPERDELTGWIGRWLDADGGDDPLRAISLGPTLPRAMTGRTTAGAALPSGALTLPSGARLEGPYAAVERGQPDGSLAARVARSGTDLLTVVHQVKVVLANEPPGTPAPGLETAPAGFPPSTPAPGRTTAGRVPGPGTTARLSGLGAQLEVVARLIRGGLPTRVYMVSLGGFDTHSAEKANHANLLHQLDDGLTSFVTAMAAHPRGRDVVVMTFSEFGRRVAENASGGTDHGTAAPVFVAGPAVKGGFYGEQPGLAPADLDQGDLRFTTDFRRVYATMLERVLGTEPARVLGTPGAPSPIFEPLALL